MNSTNPTISIITIVYNGEQVLEGTIKSVINQTYANIEYIIIDGASKDGTLEIIKKYDSIIDKWTSEPDAGLYDAMNKGLDLASGDYVWFMNAGDWVFNEKTVEEMVKYIENETDVLFGEVMLVDDARSHIGTRSEATTQKLPQNLTWKSLEKGMVVCHQAFLPKRKIAPKYIKDNLSSDIDWVIKCLKKARKATGTNMVLAEYLQGGVSKKQHQNSLWDRYAILNKHYGWLPNLWNHGVIVFRAIWHKVLRQGKASY